jgi:hypothetical protein
MPDRALQHKAARGLSGLESALYDHAYLSAQMTAVSCTPRQI